MFRQHDVAMGRLRRHDQNEATELVLPGQSCDTQVSGGRAFCRHSLNMFAVFFHISSGVDL